MSQPELINSASEDEKKGTEESETADGEYWSNFTKLQLYKYKPCVSKGFVKENCPRNKSSDLEEDNSQIGNTIWCSVENTIQWLLMRKAFASWINMKFVKDISKIYFHLF